MKVIIESVENGYIVECPDYKAVVEENIIGDNMAHDEIETFTNLVWCLHDMFGVPRDKYSEPNHRLVCKCECKE